MIRDAISLSTIAAYGIAGYIWLNPLDAMASELSPWNRTTLAETAGIIVIGWVVVVWFIVAAWSRFKDRADPLPKDRDDPINAKDFETTEDRFRRAYAESDGDHAGYVRHFDPKKDRIFHHRV